ncbi:hypothetical protein AgCh_015003 [Apium graveolens]
MATTSNHLSAPASSSSSSSTICWDVFLSFYGKDTRKNFTSHLYSALVRAGILTFMDDPELEKGEEISHGLLNAIRASKIFVVVLSENYAYSRWCLDELLEILTSKRTNGHVKSGNVHLLKLQSYQDTISKRMQMVVHESQYEWTRNESDTVQEIVENVKPLISTKDLQLAEYLVGIDSSVEEIYKKLSMESNDVRTIGICGMGGIGKTTAAKAFYNKYFNIFDISCFVDDLKQHSQGGSYLLPVLQQLFVELFGRTDYKVRDVKSGVRQLKQFLCNKKALIVVDDLDQSSYSELLVRVCNLFSAGSRIIFTTRDANLVNQLKEDISEVDIYMMRKLKQVDSLELFSYHAFRKPTPPECFKELTVSFIKYAGGLPLALKVLGSSLLGRTDVSFWNDKLAKVQEIGENDIQKILQLSYNELVDETQKAIFLYIAFFFVGRDKDEAVHVFRSCNFFPDVGIPILEERCLLTVDENNKFQMHNLIQHMGKEVIREESKDGNCRCLNLCQENACMVLQNLEGTKNIEGLIIDLAMSRKGHFTAETFERLPNLRLLEIIGALDIEGNFEKLVSLNMPCSKFKALWKGTKPLVNLKILNLSYSRNLKIMPNFTNLELVEKLSFRGCQSLLQVHPSIGQLTNLSRLDFGECINLKELTETIGQLTKLVHLDLDGCVNLKRLPEPIKQLTNLSSLNLSDCISLTRLPEQLGDLKCLMMLDVSYTSVEQLPDSIGYLKGLLELKLCNCKKLRKLPEQIGNMESLKLLNVHESAIEHLPDTFSGLINLEELHLVLCIDLTRLPNSLWKLKVLRVLNLGCCLKLEQLPEQLEKMQCLERLYASHTAIEEVPDSIGLLSKLQVLDLEFCKNLRNLPSSIWNLTSLSSLRLHQVNMDRIYFPDTIKDIKLKSLSLYCNVSLWLPLVLSFSSLEKLNLLDRNLNSSSNEPYSLSKLSNLQDLELQNCSSLECAFPEIPLNLTKLCIINYATLHLLPDLSRLKLLKILILYRWISLQSLPPLPPHLEALVINECTRLQDLPDLSNLKELRRLSCSKCSSLKSISLKHIFLQVGHNKLKSFKADTPDREVAEWFSYKSRGDALSFTIPQNSGENLFGVGLWVVYKCKYNDEVGLSLEVVITNKTKDIKKYYCLNLPFQTAVGEVLSRVECVMHNRMKSGDKIMVSFKSYSIHLRHNLPGRHHSGRGEVKVKMCGAHLIQNNLVNICDVSP